MYKATFESDLRTKLVEKHVSEQDIAYVLEQIHHGELDENMIIMNNNVYRLLDQRGLKNAFEEACNELGFIFNHCNEPER